MTEPLYVLFDLGGTLMRGRGDWEPVTARADRALTDALSVYHVELDAKVFRERLRRYYAERDQNCEETTYHHVLRELLNDLGYDAAPESYLRTALDALYAITQRNWQLEADADAALRDIQDARYRMGIFSNAGDDKDVQELVANFGIRPYFDFVLTSAACYYRKPHRRAFEIALAQWSAIPQAAVMVGDSLEADIEGAQKLGMKTVWISRRAKFAPEQKARIQPDFEINQLGELLPILKRIAKQA